MIYREYLTEYDEYSHGIKHSITISTDNYHVFKTIKAYAESVCDRNEDDLNLCEDANKGGDDETPQGTYERAIYVDDLMALPSADAVQGWIPCSERLPSESDDYICTIPLDAEETYTEVLTFHKGRFYEDDDEWGATYHDDVLAWMPLPKPYKGYEDADSKEQRR